MKASSIVLALPLAVFAGLAGGCSRGKVSAPAAAASPNALPPILGLEESIYLDKNVMTMTVNGKKQDVNIDNDTKFLAFGEPLKRGEIVRAYIGGRKKADVIVKMEKKNGKEVATEVKINPDAR